jgi:hypothetical protein
MNSLVKIKETSFDLRRFWEHSVGCALIADRLVTTGALPLQTVPKFSDYWLGTLLHDIGKFVMGLFFFSHFKQVLGNLEASGGESRDFREAEAKMGHVGLHEEVGQLLMLQVDAGLELVRSVGNHHTGGDAPSPLTSLIHVADNICKDMGMGYLKDEKGTFSPAVLESLGLDEGDIEGIRRAMEDTIVSEVGQIVSTCLAPTPSVARSPLGTTRSPDVSGSPGTGSPVAASPESGAPRSSDAAEPAEHATNANDAVEGPHDDGATRSADAASRSDDGARTAEETDRNANLRRLAELLEKIEAQCGTTGGPLSCCPKHLSEISPFHRLLLHVRHSLTRADRKESFVYVT